MTTPTLTEIIAIIDRSGSMENIRADMEGGFNAFIAEQRLQPGECRVTLAQFDTPDGLHVLYENKPIADVPLMVLEPRGGTPLLDAIGEMVDRVGARLKSTAAEKRPGRVVVMIITDGEENASTKYRKEQVRASIAHQEAKYNWQFMYLGANVDAFREARQLGISVRGVANYSANTIGVANSFMAASSSISSYRAGLTSNVELTDAQRLAMNTPATTITTSTP